MLLQKNYNNYFKLCQAKYSSLKKDFKNQIDPFLITIMNICEGCSPFKHKTTICFFLFYFSTVSHSLQFKYFPNFYRTVLLSKVTSYAFTLLYCTKYEYSYKKQSGSLSFPRFKLSNILNHNSSSHNISVHA